MSIMSCSMGQAVAQAWNHSFASSSTGTCELIYLASCYNDADPEVRQQRFEAACRAAAELISAGTNVFSPIVYSHSLCRYGLPVDWQFWERFDRRFLELCDEVIVLTLDGWRQSVGVGEEIRIARELGKPVRFLDTQGRLCEQGAVP